jgi:hypothetical protein
MNKYAKDALHGIQETSMLSDLFFSDRNMKHIQNAIRKGVYDMSNQRYVISEQNYDHLFVIMRSVYLQYCAHTNDPSKITREISKLNNITVQMILPKLYSDVEQYQVFLKDQSNAYDIQERPKNTSIAGSKTYDLSLF